MSYFYLFSAVSELDSGGIVIAFLALSVKFGKLFSPFIDTEFMSLVPLLELRTDYLFSMTLSPLASLFSLSP